MKLGAVGDLYLQAWSSRQGIKFLGFLFGKRV
jgi:hypothetical protein